MINISEEKLLRLSDAARLLPARRNGKQPHQSTLYRWANTGLRSVKLEVLRVGDTTCTSVEALQRFFAKLTELEFETEQPKSSTKAPIDSVIEEELEQHGI